MLKDLLKFAKDSFPAGNYLFKGNNRKTRTICETWSTLDIGTSILDKTIWACPNQIISKIGTISKHNSSLLIISVTQYELNNNKIEHEMRNV